MEFMSSCEVSECEGEVVNWLVEINCEVSKCWRKVSNDMGKHFREVFVSCM
jgi:hypothetical protein